MSGIEWDAEDAEPPAATCKWEGEDEEDEIKDNWDDEEEERDKTSPTAPATAKTKKKKLADKIAEKEAKQQEEKEKRRKELEEKNRSETPEDKLAEKLRIQKIQEDADFQLANELMGNNVTEEDKLLDDIDLSDRDGLEAFRQAIVSKIRNTDRLEKRPFFVSFVEDLSRDLCQNLELDEVKRVSSVLNSLYNEKVKASKPKSKKKAGNKPKLNVEQGAITDDIGNDYGAEYDDFM
ncbi:Eukaryotic translation initiation factor 3 subunit J [Halocaridina rubra]|uniref:Eukaryotic translation initiation factor 3 subunit J n=1 Tax=Halocaridina rubra TaxID=373956 RepID=A0AAN8ZQK2_HALRR